MKHKKILISILIMAVFFAAAASANALPLLQTDNETETAIEIENIHPTATPTPGENASEDIVIVNNHTETPVPGENTSKDIVIVNNNTAVPESTPEPEATPEPTTPPLTVPVLKNPQGELASTAMGFYWTPSENAEWYEITWKHESGTRDTLVMESDDWTCQMGECILYAELPANGSYTWTVTAANENETAASEESTFTVRSGIPAPDAYRPNTSLNNQKQLVFEWEDTGNPAAFRIQVADVTTDQICLDKTYSADAVLRINGVCYLETGDYLASGSYQWRVQSSSSSAVSAWSDWTAFSVVCTDCNLGNYLNTNSAAIYPKGMTIGPNVSFVWQAVTGAVSYQLEIRDSRGGILLNQEISPQSCQLETCSMESALEFTAGESYSWSISAYGWNNSFWGSDESTFTIAVIPEMQDFHYIGPEPNTSLDPDNQQIVWSDPGVSTPVFRLGIRDAAGEWLFITDMSREKAWCDGITCSVQFQDIPAGEGYEIVLIPYNEFNLPGQAVSLTFNNN